MTTAPQESGHVVPPYAEPWQTRPVQPCSQSISVITVTALCALIAGFGLSAGHWLAGYHIWLRQLAAAGCPPPDAHSGVFHVRSAATCSALKDRYPGGLQVAFTSRYSFAILFSRDGLPAAFATSAP